MADLLPLPPVTFLDPATGSVSVLWQNYLLSLQNIASSGAPTDGPYVTFKPDATLTNEQNLGALASGYLKQATAVGVATLSTVAAIPGSDVTGATLSTANDTNMSLTASGTPLTALLRAATLTLAWIGKLGLARGGTNADLSSTGGASQVLKQTSVGGAVTVGQLSASDISGLTSGTVTSVAMTVPSILSVSGSPVTTSGTLAVTLQTETANTVFAGPTTGAAATPTFRALVSADLPGAWTGFTPTITFGGAATGVTYSAQNGRYQRFGTMVAFEIVISLSSKGSSTGGVSITGMPLAALNVANQQHVFATLLQNMGATITAPASAIMQQNATTIEPYRYVVGALTQLADTDFTNTSVMFISGTYETN